MKAKLEELSKQFRYALDQLCWDKMTSEYRGFPAGTCGDVSNILAEYLRKKGVCGDIDLVCGTLSGSERSHAWLEVGGFVIDITSDQFPGNPPVIVDNSSAWHKQFKGLKRRDAGFLRDFSSEDGFTMRKAAALNSIYTQALDIL